MAMTRAREIRAVDLFCGVGGLSYGLRSAGVEIVAGIDVDPKCAYPYEANIGADFIQQDVRTVTKNQLISLWGRGSIKLLAGCAPCQPFSPFRRGVDTSSEAAWSLLGEFGRLVEETSPHVVTMENVPRIVSSQVFDDFVEGLKASNYDVSFKSCYGPEYGLPQHRRRLVLIASRIGVVNVPSGRFDPKGYVTVRDAISGLPPIRSGETHPSDSLHKTRALSDINIERIKASKPGGTWHDWPVALRSPCHQRATGSTFRNVYARMVWDEPSPTITTEAHNYGTGRFGHPSQDRAISLREAAILQGFPSDYEFTEPGAKVEFAPMGRLIGNAVPPVLAEAVGNAIVNHVRPVRGQKVSG